EFVGRQVDAAAEIREARFVEIVGVDVLAERRRAGFRGRIEEHEIEIETVTGEREHAAELARAEDADLHGRRGSGFFSTARVCRARNAVRARATRASPSATIAAASSA